MVYNLGGLISTIGAGVRDEKLAKVLGNPIFPTVALSIFLVLILTIITYKSDFEAKWKTWAILSIVTLAGTTGILFLNRYMSKKSTYGGYTGGTQLPNPSFFVPPKHVQGSEHVQISGYTQNFGHMHTPQYDNPASAFDELFNDLN